MTKYQKNEDAKKYEDKYGVDQDETMLLTDDEFINAYGYSRSDLIIENDDVAATTYYELLSEKEALEKRINEIDMELDETEISIAQTRDYMKKNDLHQDKIALLHQKQPLVTRLSVVVKQIDELIEQRESGRSR